MISYTMAIGFNTDDEFPAIEVEFKEPIKLRAYAVSIIGKRGLRFMTFMQLHHFVASSIRDLLPEIGSTIVYNDVHPFGCVVQWQRVEGGMSYEEMIDSNLNGEIVIHV